MLWKDCYQSLEKRDLVLQARCQYPVALELLKKLASLSGPGALSQPAATLYSKKLENTLYQNLVSELFYNDKEAQRREDLTRNKVKLFFETLFAKLSQRYETEGQKQDFSASMRRRRRRKNALVKTQVSFIKEVGGVLAFTYG